MTISGVPFIRRAPERKFRRLASQLNGNDLEQQRVAKPPRQRRDAIVTLPGCQCVRNLPARSF